MSTNQIKGGVALSYVIIFLTNGIGLVLTPFIIRSLGTSEYGLYTMIGALIGYMTVLDFGLNSTIIRFVAKYQAEKDAKGQENFLAHSFIMYGVLSVLVILIGLGIYFNLEEIYGETLTDDEMYKAKTMFMVLIFNLAVSLPGGAFSGICSGYEEFILPKIINISRYLLRSALVVGLLLMGGDSIGLVVLDTIMNLLFIAANAVIVFKKLKVKIHLYHFEKSMIKLMLGYSIWVFVFALVNQMRWQSGQLVLGLNYTTNIIAVYAVGITLGNYYGAFSSAIDSVLLPRAMQMVAAKASSLELTKMFIKISRLTLFVLLFILGGFVIVGKDFIYFWVGDDFKEAYLYVILMMLGLILFLSQSFAVNILKARNKLSFRGIVILVVTILGAALGYYLSLEYGGLGMIIGTVVFMLVDRLIMTLYFHNKIHLNMLYYYKNVGILFVNSAAAIFLGYYIATYLPSHSIPYALSKAIIFSAIYVIAMIFILNEDEKRLLFNMLNFVKRKIGFGK